MLDARGTAALRALHRVLMPGLQRTELSETHCPTLKPSTLNPMGMFPLILTVLKRDDSRGYYSPH